MIALAGSSAGAVHPLPESGALVIGRGQEADLVVGASDVSRRHAIIRSRPDGGYVIEDLGSSNGTSVNGRPIAGPRLLEFGDQVHIGVESVLLFTHFDSAEEQLLEQQRLELLGRIAAGVAHDLNNLLGAISATKDYLLSLGGDVSLGSADVRECLEDIDLATQRATELTPRLLHFARGSEEGRQRLDLSAICSELAQLARRTFDRRITVEASVAPRLAILGNDGQIHQILMNLVVNARDAMPDGGRLEIEARHATAAEAQTFGIAGEEGHVMIVVRDTGEGMDAHTRARIFEPFFTTKRGKGFGIGLATAKQLLVAHRGRIEVSSQPGLGTEFRLCLPAAGGLPSRKTTSQLHAPMLRPRSVLLVDDDTTFTKATARLLRHLRHQVHVAGSGRDAVQCFHTHDYDVMVLDLDMPDMTGEEVLDVIDGSEHDVSIVVLSGHAERMADLRKKRPHLQFLRKPATVDELQRAIAFARPALDEITLRHAVPRHGVA